MLTREMGDLNRRRRAGSGRVRARRDALLDGLLRFRRSRTDMSGRKVWRQPCASGIAT